MRALQLIVLSAIAVLLFAIAIDLHRLAADFQLGADIRQGLVKISNTPPAPAPAKETHAQEVDRRAREVLAIRKSVNESIQTNKEVEARMQQLSATK